MAKENIGANPVIGTNTSSSCSVCLLFSQADWYTQIYEFDFTVWFAADIVWLYITMYYFEIMHRGKPHCYWPDRVLLELFTVLAELTLALLILFTFIALLILFAFFVLLILFAFFSHFFFLLFAKIFNYFCEISSIHVLLEQINLSFELVNLLYFHHKVAIDQLH